jgi:REP element-mobilizing transposase RayT
MSDRQQTLKFRTWGGPRDGAGRKPRDPERLSTPHCARTAHYHSHPVHITLRAQRRAPYLRAELAFLALRKGIAKASRENFRILHFSVQLDHVHLIVEAHDRHALSSGARGLAIRLARGLNGAVHRRGSLWGDRWNGRALKSPRDVRNTIVYVLANHKKHLREEAELLDACSSAAWFDGFADVAPERLTALAGGLDPPVQAPRSWLARLGWRRRGLVRAIEGPA